MPRRAVRDFSFGGYDFPAGTAVGVYPDLAAAAEQAVTVTDRYEPDASAAPAYEEAFRRYQEVFDALTGTVFRAGS